MSTDALCNISSAKNHLAKNLKIATTHRDSVPLQKIRGHHRAANAAQFVLEPHELHVSRADLVSLGGRHREGRYQAAGISDSLPEVAASCVLSSPLVSGRVSGGQKFQRPPRVEGLSRSGFTVQDDHLREERRGEFNFVPTFGRQGRQTFWIYLARLPETLNYSTVRSGRHGEYMRRYVLKSYIADIVVQIVGARQVVNIFGGGLAVGVDRQQKSTDPGINLTSFETLQEIIYNWN